MKLIFVFGTVSCLIGVSFAAVNSTCASGCDDKNEVCERGYCKIKIDGKCSEDQTPTTAAPVTNAGHTEAPTGNPEKNGNSNPATAAGSGTSGAAKTNAPGSSAPSSTAKATLTDTASPTSASTTGASSAATNTTLNAKTTAIPPGRKRRDAASTTTTMPPITNTQECVENSLCIRAADKTDKTCTCKDGFAKDDNGFCQVLGSASSLRKGVIASVIVTLFMFVSL